jgi:hypothetical protein
VACAVRTLQTEVATARLTSEAKCQAFEATLVTSIIVEKSSTRQAAVVEVRADPIGSEMDLTPNNTIDRVAHLLNRRTSRVVPNGKELQRH